MSIERGHIKVKRVSLNLHSRSFSENNESTSSLASSVLPRGRSISDPMFSVVRIKTDESEASEFEDKDHLETGNENNLGFPSLKTSSFYSTLDTYQEEIPREAEKTNRDLAVWRFRSGSDSLVFSSLTDQSDSQLLKATGHPLFSFLREQSSEALKCNSHEENNNQESSVWKRRSRTVSFSSHSLLCSAISQDDVEELSNLIDCENPDLNLPDEFGNTLLHRAAIDGSYRCLNFLLSRGAEVDVTDNRGWTPLHDTVFHGHTRCAVFPWAEHSVPLGSPPLGGALCPPGLNKKQYRLTLLLTFFDLPFVLCCVLLDSWSFGYFLVAINLGLFFVVGLR